MTAVVVILLLLALLFGLGSVIEGIAWGALILLALVVAAGWLGWRKAHDIVR